MKKTVQQPKNRKARSTKSLNGADTQSGKYNYLRSGSIRWPGVLVLVLAAAVFFIVFFRLHSEDILKDSNDLFNPYGREIVEFEKATIIEIPSEEMEPSAAVPDAYLGSQQLVVIVQSGRYKGQEMIVSNYFGPDTGVPLSVGDGVTITIKTPAEGECTATVYEFNRIPILGFFLILFFVIIMLVGGRTGLRALIGLIITFICLFTILIPLLLKGAPTVLTTFFVCAYIALVCFTILGGVHRKTISAFLGTLSGALLAMIFGLAAQYFAKIDGLRLEDAEPLLQLNYSGGVIDIQGLLVAGIIISALGAVMDVAMSISSALEEVHAANPALSRKELIRSGMNVGRDMVGTMTNTLLLAFLGSEFTLMIFFIVRELTFYHLFSTAFIALEIISGISASIGMILAIPLTVLISSALLTRNRRRK